MEKTRMEKASKATGNKCETCGFILKDGYGHFLERDGKTIRMCGRCEALEAEALEASDKRKKRAKSRSKRGAQPTDHVKMADTLDSFQNGLEALQQIQNDVAAGKDVIPEERQLWAACERFVKTFRRVSTKIVERLRG